MIGAYAFTLNDWKEFDYPLDLWLEWNSKHFDKIILATYEKLNIEVPSNVFIKEIPFKPNLNTEEYYIKGKTYAQRFLDTDWKVMLDIDEFVAKRIDTSNLNPRKAYALEQKNLYGNIETEIINAFTPFYYRIHYGYRKVDNTGGNVIGPYAADFNLRNFINDAFRKIFKIGHYIPYHFPYSNYKFEIWHTGAVRRPSVMSKKWELETIRAIKSHPGIDSSYKDFLEYVHNIFNYKNYKTIWPSSELKRVNVDALPNVLKINRDRFNFAQFPESLYKT
ncbi:hypothetical protein [Acidiplasma sp.]|uniref:hypothetical protein n=1 Tax=Acidiplasma sp. TaxID=1872114 RepID=UPI00258EBDCA|nr:hypothetical protein [Acidiplasma sp.]